jgi:hypothetical protein
MENLAKCKKAYWAAKTQAKIRGKDWKYTLEEWIAWWEEKLGANWLEKRGRGKDKYVMGRIGDKGPYSPENVKCITNAQNGYDRRLNGSAARGERSGGRKLNNKQVREIYLSSDTLKILAQRYSVGLWAIFDIKKGKTWRHITKALGSPPKNKKGRPRTKPLKIRKNRKIGTPFPEEVKKK